jgi:VWFA-related protein
MRAPRLVFALVAGLLAGGALAQPSSPAPAPPTPGFDERIEVRVVNVEVVVSDAYGNRVSGLAPAEFRLRVDGREVPIDYFTEVRGGEAAAPSGVTAAGKGVQALPSVTAGAPVGTSYLVFVDDYFSFGPNRDEALRNLKKDLGRLGPNDRMALVAYDGRKLERLTSWTGSRTALAQAIDAALQRPALGLRRRGELAAFESIRRAGGEGGAPGAGQPGASQGPRSRELLGGGLDRLGIEELPFARRLAEQVEQSVDAAVATMRGFASPPGRKVMLLLAGGWPYSPADYVVNDPSRPILEQEVPSGEKLLRPLNDTANLLGYTVYPADVQGLEEEMAGADQGSPPAAGAFSVRPAQVRQTIIAVAAETGGQPILAGHHDSPLAIAASDTRSYYWIGFTPTFKRDDARHKLAVEMTKPGMKVRARADYLDLSRRGEAAMTVESAMLFGGAPGSERLPIQVGAPVSSGRREIAVPITVAVPVSSVTFVPLAGKYVAELELRVAAIDKDGHRSDVPALPFKLTVTHQPEAGKYVRYQTTVKLRKIDQSLTVALVDPLSDKVLLTTAEIKPK